MSHPDGVHPFAQANAGSGPFDRGAPVVRRDTYEEAVALARAAEAQRDHYRSVLYDIAGSPHHGKRCHHSLQAEEALRSAPGRSAPRQASGASG